MNCRFVPVVEKLRFTMRSPSPESTPDSLSSELSFFNSSPSKTASTVQTSGAGANERFVRAFTQQQLERADDDRLAGARFPRDGGESRPELPFEIFDERQVLNSQQGQNGGHRGRS